MSLALVALLGGFSIGEGKTDDDIVAFLITLLPST